MACCHRQARRREGEQFARSNVHRYPSGMHHGLASRDEASGCRGTRDLEGQLRNVVERGHIPSDRQGSGRLEASNFGVRFDASEIHHGQRPSTLRTLRRGSVERGFIAIRKYEGAARLRADRMNA